MAGGLPLSATDAIVLAGGLGTRLAAVLPESQKVAAPVAGEPFVARLVRWLGAAGVRKVVLALGHRAGDVEALFRGRRGGRPEVAFSVEAMPLGTGGAARLALARTASDPVLVLNGDSFAGIDLARLVARHRQSAARATLAAVRVPRPGRYGLVTFEGDGRVRSFVEKPDARPDSGWINAGVYVLAREVIAAIAPGRAVSLEREVFPPLAGAGLHACPFEARFIDIGTPESLAAADAFFAAGAP